MSTKYIAFVMETAKLMPIMFAAEIDQAFGFHESSFLDFAETDGVRSFIELGTEHQVFVADVRDLCGLINVIKVHILSIESGMDDFSEEDEQFIALTSELEDCQKILSTLEELETIVSLIADHEKFVTLLELLSIHRDLSQYIDRQSN